MSKYYSKHIRRQSSRKYCKRYPTYFGQEYKTDIAGYVDPSLLEPNVLTPKFSKIYKPVKKLGEGTFGQVWLVEERKNPDKKYAVKIIKLQDKDYGIDNLTLSEITIYKRLNHPNIIKIYDIE